MSTSVELTFEGPVARITFWAENGIHILDSAAREQLSAAIDVVSANHGCRVVVFEADGRTFIAGADIKEMRQLDAASAYRFSRAGQRLLARIERLSAITIVAPHAACVGGGCELALACDLRLASEAATIGLPEVSLGLVPGWGGTVRAARLLGSIAARRLILSGELLPASRAAAVGLIDDVIAPDRFRDAVNERIAQLLSRAPGACARAKRLVHRFTTPANSRSSARSVDEFRAESRAFADCFRSGEATVGLTAFLEKRRPEWT